MRHRDVTLREIFAVLDILNGKSGIAAMIAGRELEPTQFGEETLGRIIAVLNKLNDMQVHDALLADEKVLKRSDSGVVIEDAVRTLVDSNGRFIFENFDITAPYTNADWSYGFDQSIELSDQEILGRLEDVFQVKNFISVQQFTECKERKKEEVLLGPYANLFKGKYARPFAIAIPPTIILPNLLGTALADIFVPVAERGYKRQFPERAFNNHRAGTLEGQVETFPGSRQEHLIAALAEGPVVLWVFMNCLQGGSINADREVIKKLPDEFILGGTIASGTVIAVYPEIAAVRAKNPLYFNAADVWGSSCSLYFDPSDSRLDFDYWPALGCRNGDFSGSVVLRCVV